LAAVAERVGDLPLALEEAAAYLEQTGESLTGYLELLDERSRELFGLDHPGGGDPDDGGAGGDQRRVATVWSVSLDRVHQQAPAAEALLSLVAFLAPDVPRGLPSEQPQLLPEPLAAVVADRLAYNRVLAIIGRYSLATVTPTAIGVHRLVQAVIRARLGPAGEHAWAQTAVNLIRARFPTDSGEMTTWPAGERLLPHLRAVAEHAQRLDVAGEATGWLLARASTYLRARGQYRQAKPLAEQAVDLTEAALGPDHPEVGWRHDELGRLLRHLGDLAGARTQAEQALAITEAAFGPDHPDVGTQRNELGLVLRDLGDLAGARTQHEQALAIGEAALGPDHPYVATWRNNLGVVLQALGDLAGARTQFQQALAITEVALGPDHPDMGIRRSNLGSVLRDLGDLAGARTQFQQALAITEAALGPDHPTVRTIRENRNELE
jgi:tetratricopeptide (TPR) repeat protein